MGHLKKKILQWQQKHCHFNRIYNTFASSTLIYNYWCQNMEKNRSKLYHERNLAFIHTIYSGISFFFKESLYDLNKLLQLWLWFKKALQHIFNSSMILACPPSVLACDDTAITEDRNPTPFIQYTAKVNLSDDSSTK